MNVMSEKPLASSDIQINKQNLRRHFKSLLSRIPGDDRRLYEFNLKKGLEAFIFEKGLSHGLWASYMPMATEANPHVDVPLISWAYPKTNDEGMEFFTCTQGAVFETSSLGVEEPVATTTNKINKNDILGILVPGLAFSKTGARLGRGKAFYDKYLTDFKGIKVGLAFQMQMTDEVPLEAHDVTMDYIVTDEHTITCEVKNG